ncbi:MAG: ion transporter [Beutenbergiaceae bacterium]
MATTTAEAPQRDAPAGAPPPRWYSRVALGRWIESDVVQRFVIAVIIVNAATLGFETSESVMARFGEQLHVLDQICLAIFVCELLIKLYAFRFKFFRVSWNVFDLAVVAIALIPGSGAFGVLRSLRVLRVLRLISMVPQLRRVVEALVRAIPGILSIGALLILLFYVGGVMATMLFRDAFPDEFGTLPRTLFSLFQVMTLDDWGNLTRSVLEVYPWALGFFLPFVLLSAFTVLNLFIAVIVDAMQHLRDDDGAEEEGRKDAASDRIDAAPADDDLRREIAGLREQITELSDLVRARSH